jgi:ABC-type transport system substrate-binding protein
LPIIPEYAAALAQFKAGNLYTMGSRGPQYGVRPEDILTVKREEPRLLLYQGDLGGSGSTLALGYLPGSPFLDERVRQAISMSWDRDLYIETFNNVSSFTNEGLPVEIRWSSHLSPTFEGWWLDPKAKDFGPNAKYFQRDVPEAKKLLAAAGYPNGIQNVTSNYVTGPELPTSKQAEVIDAMIAEIGITSKPRPIDYAKEYIPQFRDGRGRYEGWAYITAGGGSISGVDAVANLDTQWWSKGGVTFLGFDSSSKGDQSGDPQLDALIAKARVERDTEKRRALIFDVQRHLGKTWYAYPRSGVSTGFEMAWPCLANFRTFRIGNPPSLKGKWIDDTKPPFKSA